MKAGSCRVCDELSPVELVELDALLSDPRRWPRTLWGRLPVPKGILPPRMRRLGAVGMGLAWIEAHGKDMSRSLVASHYRHIPQLLISSDELIASGIIEDGPRSEVPDLPIDPTSYLRYYDRTVKLGLRAVAMLEDRLQDFEDAGEDVPLEMLKMLIDAGVKMATSQAQIASKGKFHQPEGDEDEGFRLRGQPAPSIRFGDHRVRQIEGERRPVVDRGPADRAHYNERAAQEGSPKLPS